MRDNLILSLLGGRIEEVTNSLHNRTTWGVKRTGIGISDLNQTETYNFEMLEKCCKFLSASLLIKEELYLRSHATQVKEGHEEGR